MITALVTSYYQPDRQYLNFEPVPEFFNISLSLTSLLIQPLISEVIIVNQRSEHQPDCQIKFINDRISTHPQLKIINCPDNKKNYPFNKSWLLNVGIKAAKNKIIMMSDIDCVVLRDFSERILQLLQSMSQHKEFSKFVISCACWDNTEPFDWLNFRITTIEEITPKIRKHYLKQQHESLKEPGGVGNIITLKNNLIALRGYDERFNIWGYEDCDLYARLLHYGAVELRNKYHILHQAHNRPIIDGMQNVILQHRGMFEQEKGGAKLIRRNSKGWGEKAGPHI